MSEQKATNVHWHGGEINRPERAQLLGHGGATLWFTGLSGSGKSTIAVAVEQALYQRGVLVYRLDGDNIRLGINKNLGFSAEDRAENIRRIGAVAQLFCDAGAITICSFVSPYKKDRDAIRALVPERFIEVHVDCSVDECARRDPKGLYKKAMAGEIPNFTGVSAPYEAPIAPEVHIDTASSTVEQGVEKVVASLTSRGLLSFESESNR